VNMETLAPNLHTTLWQLNEKVKIPLFPKPETEDDAE
jgi:hypothetical protein